MPRFVFQKEYEENPSDQLQSAIVRVSRNVKFYEDEIALHTAVKPATHPGARVWRSEERQEKDERPPTPPPIERIPRHHDDCTTPASPKNSAPNINRRRSNPEAMHMGISRMAIAAGLVDQSALNRSTSSVNVKNDSRQSCSIPDEMPPALPAKRHRTRNQLGDATDMGTPSGSPPPPYPDFSLAMKANGHKVPKSSSFSGASVHNASRSHPVSSKTGAKKTHQNWWGFQPQILKDFSTNILNAKTRISSIALKCCDSPFATIGSIF